MATRKNKAAKKGGKKKAGKRKVGARKTAKRPRRAGTSIVRTPQ
jgi:hypothetical protein